MTEIGTLRPLGELSEPVYHLILDQPDMRLSLHDVVGMHRRRKADVTGVLVRQGDDDWPGEVWATWSCRPFDLMAEYERLM